jgi:hypothetical protein
MLNVICLKHGTKYGPEYVNKLYNMISRNLTIPYRFVCFTDDATNLNQKIEIKKLPENKNFNGWWWKPYIFKKEHFADGDTNLFFDLDMVIVGNIDHLINFQPTNFVGLRDVGRVFNQNIKKLGSAVMKWPANHYSDIWDILEKDPARLKKFHGDQDWIWSLHSNNIVFFPDEWIRSYKWEIRSRADLTCLGMKAKFKEIKNPVIPKDTAVLAFHGYPQITSVEDPVILDNWR